MNDPQQLVLAISDDDRSMHVGPIDRVGSHFATLPPHPQPPFPPPPASDVDGLRGQYAEHFAGGVSVPASGDVGLVTLRAPQPGWQFYSVTGVPLSRAALLEPPHLGVAQSEPGGWDPWECEDSSEAVLLLRIARVLGYFQAVLDRSPELGTRPGGPPRLDVPHPVGTLTEVMVALGPEFGELDPRRMPNRGGWLHMLAHAAGVAHR